MTETPREPSVDPEGEIEVSQEIGVNEASTHYEIVDASQTGE